MSAVVQDKHIETIFDYSPSEAELANLLGDADVRDDEAEYKQFLDNDSAMADLYRLFMLRGDNSAAKSFLEKIKDVSYRNTTSLRDYFPE